MKIPIANFITQKKKGKNEKRGGSVLKCFILTELGRAGRENIWHSVMAVMTSDQIFSQAILGCCPSVAFSLRE